MTSFSSTANRADVASAEVVQFPAGQTSFPSTSYPPPGTLVDREAIRRVAAQGSKVAEFEKRAQAREMHSFSISETVRSTLRSLHGQLEGIKQQIFQARGRLSEIKDQLGDFTRYGPRNQKEPEKERSDALVSGSAVFAIVLGLIATFNGAALTSSLLLSSTQYADAAWKAYAYSVPLFLSPSMAIAIGFHRTKHRPWLSRLYFVALLLGLLVAFSLFVTTWVWTYQPENLEDIMGGIATLGVDETPAPPLPLILREAAFLSVASNVVLDVTAVSLVKCYLLLLSWRYDLFTRRRYQEEPEYRDLQQEQREEERKLAELEARKKEIEARLEQEEEEHAEEFKDAVLREVDAELAREIEKHRLREEEIKRKREAAQAAVDEQAAKLEEAQRKLDEIYRTELEGETP